MNAPLLATGLLTLTTVAGCATTTVVPADPRQASAEVARLATEAAQNPLLAPWPGPYGGVPPWDQVASDRFPAAFEQGIALRAAEIAAIADNPAPPTFANTIVPMQDAGRHLGRARVLFSVLTANVSTPEARAVQAEWSPKLTAADNAITFNRALFARIDALFQERTGLGLDAAQLRLLERTRANFVRAGAALGADAQARVGAINQELSSLFAEFNKRLLADEDTAIFIEREADLEGLTPVLRDAAASAAAARGRPGAWAIVNTRSSVDPFLTFSANRGLREKVYRAFKNRGDNGGANDTNELIAKIVAVRAERAKLLGFPTHAHFRMDDTMAKDPARAQDLMMRVWPAAVARVHEEVADMQAVADREGAGIRIEPWDYLYYAEKVRRERFALDLDVVRQYFQLDNVVAGAFHMAGQLYGLGFREITGTVPVFHPDVRVFEVTDRDGSHRGLFYFDSFARPGKRSGAWALNYRGHENFTGERIRPLTSNNNNFVKPTAGKPVLISLDDARTLFHEFGHALHGLLSEVRYPGLAITPRDYVEFPSQVHEHWVLTRPILDRFALHVETGKPMPQELVERIENAGTFNKGYETVALLSSALVDMALHNRADGAVEPDAFERETLAALGMPREMEMRHRLPQFGHLFSSDAYSAGYYSYVWSEVMDEDTWEMFEATGNVFDPAVAAGMRDIILGEGNSSDRAEAYRRFRGRDPDVDALLRARGFK
ncbi:MAG TPA: M3 family metallopeptidase [Steroidobacteraceae bacterium]|nr:M3 family metallopeptidase [Steroidobacteraceae bacterium]